VPPHPAVVQADIDARHGFIDYKRVN